MFDDEILYGDIVKGLPLPDGTVDGVFSSHVLEHLALVDFYVALRNIFKLLKPGGTFRVIVPDLNYMVDQYKNDLVLSTAKNIASVKFIEQTGLGRSTRRKKGIRGILECLFGNSAHPMDVG